MPQNPKTIEPIVGERQPGESKPAVVACNDFLRMGPGRGMADLIARYKSQAAAEGEHETPPTLSYGQIRKWSMKFDWPARAEEYDAQDQKSRNTTFAERRREILEEGLALDHERVSALKHIATDLLNQYNETDDNGRRVNLWVRDVKQIGQGPTAERVDIVRFNAALVEQLRGALDDIAKEVGGRVQKQETNLAGDMTVKVLRGISMDDI